MGGNLADLFEAAADATPSAEAFVVDGQRLTFAELDERANRLAGVLAAEGVGTDDRVGVLLGNTNEHIEALLACFKLRAVPVNLNTRFVAAEVAELMALSGASIVIHEEDLGVLLPPSTVGIARGEGYEGRLAAAAPHPPAVPGPRSGDDHYVLYTGGTTDRPKGVVWRHRDLHVAALGGSYQLGARRTLVACPFFHGTGQWMSLATLLAGGTVVTTRHRSIEPEVLWELAAAERTSFLVLVGDAYARPLVEALEANPGRWSLDGLTAILSGGANLSPEVGARLIAALPCAMIVDGFGATETGGHTRMVTVAGSTTAARTFVVDENTALLGDDLRPIPPGDQREGWLARSGELPIGYEADGDATADTFPVVDGIRWAIPGDRARWVGSNRIEVLGRSERTINTGGEKVHPEEVEEVLRSHPQVVDAIVVGLPDERWGEMVTAVVKLAEGARLGIDEVAAHCRGDLAGFKVPRRLVVVDEIPAAVAGKPDHRWARERALRG